MNTHVKHHVAAWLSGTLSEEHRKAVTAHLQECRECREYFQQLERALDSAGELPADLVLHPGRLTTIKARAAEQPARRVPVPETVRWATILLIALISGIFLGQLSYAPTSTDPLITAFQQEYESLDAQLTISEAANELWITPGENHEN